MLKRITMFVATALLALAMAVPAAFATPAEDACTADGGTYVQVSQSGPNKYECQKTVATNPSGNDNPKAATPFEETDSTSQPGQGGGGGETSNNNFEEVDGPNLNRGGNAPGGQQ